MYKSKEENVEIYFICYKKEEMELVESYYDEVLDSHCWYFNAYLAYKHWLKNFKDSCGKKSKNHRLIPSEPKELVRAFSQKINGFSRVQN